MKEEVINVVVGMFIAKVISVVKATMFLHYLG